MLVSVKMAVKPCNNMAGNLRLALLIDADNIPHKHATQLLTLLSNLGTAGVRRVYGDWGNPILCGWRDCVLLHSLHPIQQIAYVAGKNATDIALVIDAMDLMHSGRFDGFCLVSSDSDFTPLAIRIREQGLKVFGFGTRTTPQSFVVSCDQFEFLDPLEEALKSTPVTAPPAKKVAAVTKPTVEKPKPASAVAAKQKASQRSVTKPPDKEIRKLLMQVVTAVRDGRGWASFADIGSKFKDSTGAAPKDLGYGQLQELIEATGDYEFDRSLSSRKCIVVRPKSSLLGFLEPKLTPGSALDSPGATQAVTTTPAPPAAKSKAVAPVKKVLTEEIRATLKAAVMDVLDHTGWAGFGAIGSSLVKQAPEFSAQDLGYEKLWMLIEATNDYEFDRSFATYKSIVVRPKPQPT